MRDLSRPSVRTLSCISSPKATQKKGDLNSYSQTLLSIAESTLEVKCELHANDEDTVICKVRIYTIFCYNSVIHLFITLKGETYMGMS